MDIETDIKSVSFLKSNLAEILTEINEHQRPLIITQNGQTKAVLQDPQTYQKTKKALNLLKLIAQSEADIKNGDTISHEEAFNSLDKYIDQIPNNEKKT